MKFIALILVIAAMFVSPFAVLFLNQATLGASILVAACFTLILARIAQAAADHAEVMKEARKQQAMLADLIKRTGAAEPTPAPVNSPPHP